MNNRKNKPAVSTEFTEGIVTSDSIRKASRRGLLHVPRVSVRSLLLALLAVGVLVAGYGGYVWLGANHNQTALKPEVVKSPRDKVDELSSKLYAAGNSAKVLQAAQAELVRLEAGAPTKADREIYSLASANLYRQANQLSDALTQAKTAEATYKTALSAATLAEVYRAQHDYANAAKYYGLASERSPKTPLTERSNYNDYRLMKEEMEAR